MLSLWKDYLDCLHAEQQREQEPSALTSMSRKRDYSLITINETAEQVDVRKRSKLLDVLHSDSSVLTTTLVRKSKGVKFSVDQDKIFFHHYTEEDLVQAWISSAESEAIRRDLQRTVAHFRLGQIDHDEECIRGLEYHVNDSVRADRISRRRAFVAYVLSQYRFFLGLMGRPNEVVVSKLSQVLSTPDTEQATALAIIDANEVNMGYDEPRILVQS